MSERDIQARLDEIRTSYIASLTPRRENIVELWAALQTDWQSADFEALHRLVHSLAGSAETFGFADITQAARTLVDALRQLENTAPAPTDRTAIDVQINRLVQLLAQHSGSGAS